MIYMYKSEAPLSLAVPIVRMGAAVIAATVGILFFQERILAIHMLGIALSIVAVILMTR